MKISLAFSIMAAVLLSGCYGWRDWDRRHDGGGDDYRRGGDHRSEGGDWHRDGESRRDGDYRRDGDGDSYRR